MLSGKEKAKILLFLLGDKSSQVMSLLAPEHSLMLSDPLPQPIEPQNLQAVTSDVLSNFHRFKNEPVPKSIPIESNASEFVAKESWGSSFGSGSDFNFSFGDEPSSQEEKEESDATDLNLRTPEEMATLLADQKPQIIAFFLHHLDVKLKEKILQSLPEDVIEDIKDRQIDQMPIYQKIFDSLYNQICLKKPSSSENS
jgi:flagellar motor switch protein FliG